MERNLTRFIRALRSAGADISTAEAIDAAQVLALGVRDGAALLVDHQDPGARHVVVGEDLREIGLPTVLQVVLDQRGHGLGVPLDVDLELRALPAGEGEPQRHHHDDQGEGGDREVGQQEASGYACPTSVTSSPPAGASSR